MRTTDHTYSCDGPDCESEAEETSSRILPQGWVEVTARYPREDGKGYRTRRGHFCSAYCAAYRYIGEAE